MKKQYIAPALLTVELTGVGMIAASANTITDNPDITVDQGTITGGNAGGADVKESTNAWDDEW